MRGVRHWQSPIVPFDSLAYMPVLPACHVCFRVQPVVAGGCGQIKMQKRGVRGQVGDGEGKGVIGETSYAAACNSNRTGLGMESWTVGE